MDWKKENQQTIQLIDGIIEGVAQGKKDVFNPVYFYGDPVDVRMIMDRLKERYRAAHPQDLIIHTNGVDFCAGYLYAAMDGKAHFFESTYKTAHLLIFENTEILAGRRSTMDAFYRIVDAIFESGGHVVFGASTTPQNMPSLEPRNQAQMEGGIICCVDLKRPLSLTQED